MAPIVIAAIVAVAGQALSSAFGSQSAADTTQKNMDFQSGQAALDREQRDVQFGQSLGQRKYEFESEAPARAANVFQSLQPALKEQRRKKDLTAAWATMGSRK